MCCMYTTFSNTSYEDKIKYLKLLFFEAHHKIADLTSLFHLANNKIDCPNLLAKFSISKPFRVLCHACSLFNIPRHHTIIRIYLLRDYQSNTITQPVFWLTWIYLITLWENFKKAYSKIFIFSSEFVCNQVKKVKKLV